MCKFFARLQKVKILKKENEQKRGKKHKRVEDDDFQPEVNVPVCLLYGVVCFCNVTSIIIEWELIVCTVLN